MRLPSSRETASFTTAKAPSQGGWMLLDFSDVVVHLFRPETRDYYRIEEAWPAAVETVRIQ